MEHSVKLTERKATPEPELIELAKGGDSLAWVRLVRCHEQLVFRLALLKLGDAEDAKDVAQETFIRAFQKLSRFDNRQSFKPWLLRIATRLASNKRRGLNRYRSLLLRTGPPPEPINWGVNIQQEQSRLWSAVQRLPQASQDLIWLRYFIELSESEAAATLGVALGTVKSRTHRALKKLERLIADQYPELIPQGSENG